MSTPEKVTARRRRQLLSTATRLQEVLEKAEADILVFIHDAKAEGLSYAAIGGMFALHPTSVPARVAKGAEIVAERRGRKEIPG